MGKAAVPVPVLCRMCKRKTVLLVKGQAPFCPRCDRRHCPHCDETLIFGTETLCRRCGLTVDPLIKREAP